MSGLEIAGLVIGAAGLVPVLQKAYKVVAVYRVRRRLRLQPSGVSPLVGEISRSEVEIKRLYANFLSVYGDAFARGDDVACRSLDQLINLLHRDLVSVVQAASCTGRFEDPFRLVGVTASGRGDAIGTLSQLAQRVAAARPVPRLLPAKRDSDDYFRSRPAITQYSRPGAQTAASSPARFSPVASYANSVSSPRSSASSRDGSDSGQESSESAASARPPSRARGSQRGKVVHQEKICGFDGEGCEGIHFFCNGNPRYNFYGQDNICVRCGLCVDCQM